RVLWDYQIRFFVCGLSFIAYVLTGWRQMRPTSFGAWIWRYRVAFSLEPLMVSKSVEILQYALYPEDLFHIGAVIG
ncbi:hypothetical protein L195_g056945, partial [Trifolium pratense]